MLKRLKLISEHPHSFYFNSLFYSWTKTSSILMNPEPLNNSEGTFYCDIQMNSVALVFLPSEMIGVWTERCNRDWLWQWGNEANQDPNEEMQPCSLCSHSSVGGKKKPKKKQKWTQWRRLTVEHLQQRGYDWVCSLNFTTF